MKQYYVTLYWDEWFFDKDGRFITGNQEHDNFEVEAENENEAREIAGQILDFQCSGYADQIDKVKDYDVKVFDSVIKEVPQDKLKSFIPYREKEGVWAPENELDETIAAIYRDKQS